MFVMTDRAIVPTLDSEAACQQATDAGLIVHSAQPLNCEMPLASLVGRAVTQTARLYMRNNFQIPDLDSVAYRLDVKGLIERPQRFSVRELQSMRSTSIVATLECAGNGRSRFERKAEGEQWGLGAVGTAEWTGVPLIDILDRAGVRANAQEVLFRGADGGTVAGRAQPLRFERSLRLDDARRDEVLLAYAMNGEPLPIEHGRPLRLIVPGWYAVASVKWLNEIELIDREFVGHYQGDKYRYEWERGGRTLSEPVTLQRVRSLILQPAEGADLAIGDLLIRGVAWSGAAPIARVEVSVNDGAWQEARLLSNRDRFSWHWWELTTRIDASSSVAIRARATDLTGQTQPDKAEWNRLGYGNNAIHTIRARRRA